MNNNPLVSVCIPTFNNARYIGKMLESVINQSYKNIEIIVCDNASTDNTKDVVSTFIDPCLSYYRNSNHLLTAEENYNESTKYANGDFIAIYHSDDVYDKDIVLRENEKLVENTELGAVFAYADKIDINGEYIDSWYVSARFRRGGEFDFYRIFRSLLIDGATPLFCPSFMARKEVLTAVGFFNPQEFGTSSDTELYLRILEKFPVAIIPGKMVHYRITNSQVSSKYNYLRTDQADFIKVARKFIRSPSLTSKQSAELADELTFQIEIDNIHRAVSYYITNRDQPALELLNNTLNFKFLLSTFRKVRNIKYFLLAISILIGMRLKIKRIKKIVESVYNKRWKS